MKKEAEGLDFSPYPGELGKKIYANISKEAWQLWMKHQTMLVNENRLNLADQRARQYLARQMELFLFGEGGEKPAGYVPPADAPDVRMRSGPRETMLPPSKRIGIYVESAGISAGLGILDPSPFGG